MGVFCIAFGYSLKAIMIRVWRWKGWVHIVGFGWLHVCYVIL